MINTELKKFLKNNNLGTSLENLSDIKCELLDDNFSLAHIYQEELPVINYYLITAGDKSTIMMETIPPSNRKSYKLLFPLDKRQFKYANGIIITYNDTDKRFGIYNLATNKFELNEINTFESVDFFDDRSNRDFIVKDKRRGGSGLLSLRNGHQLLVPAKYLAIKELIVNSTLRVYEVEDKNHHRGLYAYYTTKNCRYLARDDRNIYFNATKQSVIPPMFDKLGDVYYSTETHQPTGDTICNSIFVEVVVDGKIGLLDVVKKYFVMPPIFDQLDTNNHANYVRDPRKFINGLCGYIGDKKYLYWNNQLCEINAVEFNDEKTAELTEKLIRTRRKK